VTNVSVVSRHALATVPSRRYRQDGTEDDTGAGNAIVPSTGVRLFTAIQQMATLQLSTKATTDFFK